MNKKYAFLCWLPLVMMFFVLVPWIIVSISMNTSMIAESVAVPILMVLLIFINIWIISVWAVMIWLIVRTVKNPNFDGAMKTAWVFALYLLNVFAFPVYYYVVMKKEMSGLRNYVGDGESYNV